MLRTILYPLPYGVKGYIKENIDNEPVCILNSRLTYEANIDTYKHELRHRDDLNDVVNVNELEVFRHK
jgi:hypothetical protein